MQKVQSDLEEEVLHVLQDVTDPEMPFISIVDLGMVEKVEAEDYHVFVKLLPTFSGCPALDMIKGDVLEKVRKAISKWNESLDIQVEFSFHPPWTTNRISEEGRKKLNLNGISPPPAEHKHGEPWEVDCPYCGSTYVTMENIFGPTACRSILYCDECNNPFEAMKPIANLNEKVE
ncbi:1,2-phenylacetyl-CoA epoxidase subunit PaaD [Oceanobacillus senegalensis]|uniref:1,2-phenylacetyl-CoA epoxidase subunit PaaD n=1 Tax=Oceanobacillus senegalensis TaxID=1936063 RepID=UPI000A3104B8|nr:1,2-phenylacetyl-CoA epoxidase subunit PaaD [Oceanobacillus senegalensis]